MPFRLTSDEYKECWSERIDTEQQKLADMVAEQARLAQEASKKAAAAAAAAAAASKAAQSTAMVGPGPEGQEDDGLSDVSSRVSGMSNSSSSRIQRLEIKLEKERRARAEIEKDLERARQPPLIA
jgi:hypothetical protein